MSNRWHVDPKTCTHENDNVCPFCDFDRYYASTYPDCPWREADSFAEVDAYVAGLEDASGIADVIATHYRGIEGTN